MAWLSGYNYRKSVAVSRASGAVTNYQIKLLIGESSGASGEQVDCGGLCKIDFGDLRFTNASGDELDYWIESVSGTTPNQLATVWVEFDSVGTTDTTFYMYYGNATASTASDGSTTFLFFDDFSGDLSKWSGETTHAAISSGIMTLTGTGGDYEIHTPAFAGDIAIRSKTKLAAAQYSQIGFSDDPVSSSYTLLFYSTARTNNSVHATSKAGSAHDYSTVALGFGSYHIYDIIRSLTGTPTVRDFIDGTQSGTGSTTDVPDISITGMFRAVGTGVTVMSDWFLIRHYIEVEPTVGSWGAAEEYTLESNITMSSGAVFGGSFGYQTSHAMSISGGAIAGGTSIFGMVYQPPTSVWSTSGGVVVGGTSIKRQFTTVATEAGSISPTLVDASIKFKLEVAP